jgi:hypothetical protein
MTLKVEIVEKLKTFTDYEKKDQDELIEKNYEKLFEHLVDWDMEYEALSEDNKNKMEALGLEELAFEVDSYNNIFLTNTRLSNDTKQSIDVMIKEETDEKNKKMLLDVKESYKWILEVTDEYADYIIEIYNQRVYLEENNNYEMSKYLGDDEIKKRISEMEKRTTNKETIKHIKNFKIKMIFNSTIDFGELDNLFEDVLKEERKKFDAFTSYLDEKIITIKKSIEQTYSYIDSYENIADYLKEDDDIKFDEDGKVVFT